MIYIQHCLQGVLHLLAPTEDDSAFPDMNYLHLQGVKREDKDDKS